MKEMPRKNEASGGKGGLKNDRKEIWRRSVRESQQEMEMVNTEIFGHLCSLESKINRWLFGQLWSVWVGNKLELFALFTSIIPYIRSHPCYKLLPVFSPEKKSLKAIKSLFNCKGCEEIVIV